MELEIGVLPADVVRLIVQHSNWTTACAFTLSCSYWYKSLHDYLRHPTITVLCPSFVASNVIVIHKGRFLQCGGYSSTKGMFWGESEFKQISDIPPFVNQLELILSGCADIPSPPEPTPNVRRRKERPSIAHFEHAHECIVTLTRLDGTKERWDFQDHVLEESIPADTLNFLVRFLIKTIDESVPPLNDDIGHRIIVKQSLGGTVSKLTLDDEANMLWTTEKGTRTIRKKYPLQVYHNLKHILLSDKKHTLELAEKPKVTKSWVETVVSFEAYYTVDEKTVYNLEKFVYRNSNQHICEEHSIHREKKLKSFIKELSKLYNEETCLFGNHFFCANRKGRLQHAAPAQWQSTASEPKLNTRALIANRITPIFTVNLHSNKAFTKRRCNWGNRYLDVSITYLGNCVIERFQGVREHVYLDLDATSEMFFELFSYAVKKDPKISNIPVEPYGQVTHIAVRISPRTIALSPEGIRYCWNWVQKNLLGSDRPIIRKDIKL